MVEPGKLTGLLDDIPMRLGVLTIAVIVSLRRQRLEADDITFFDRATFDDLCNKTTGSLNAPETFPFFQRDVRAEDKDRSSSARENALSQSETPGQLATGHSTSCESTESSHRGAS